MRELRAAFSRPRKTVFSSWPATAWPSCWEGQFASAFPSSLAACIVFSYMYSYHMSRRAVSQAERQHGAQLGRVIAEERDRHRWSAADLARQSGVSVDAIRSLESGRVPTPSFLTVARLSESLGLSLNELQAKISSPVRITEVRRDDACV